MHKAIAAGVLGVAFAWAVTAPTAGAELPGPPPDTEIAAQMAKDLDLSPEAALRRVRIQNRAKGLADQLETKLGDDYAGAWFDAATGAVRVGVLPDADRAAIEEILTQRGLSLDGALVPVRSSSGDLEATVNLLTKELLGPKLSHDVASVRRDDVGNAVVVELQPDASDAAREKAAALRDAFAKGQLAAESPAPPAHPVPYKSDARDAQGTPQPEKLRRTDVVLRTLKTRNDPKTNLFGCDGTSCGFPLRGGTQILEGPHSGGGYGACSAGFIGSWWSGTAAYYFTMTAGHCIDGSATPGWISRNPDDGVYGAIGNSWTWRFGGNVGNPTYLPTFDAGLINMDLANYWSYIIARPSRIWMHGWAGGGEHWTMSGQAAGMVGEYGCRSGYASTYTCGTISSVNTSVTYGTNTVTNLISVPGACGVGGDSGGVYLDGTTALGISSGSSRVIATGACVEGYFAHVTDITSWLGVSIYIT